MQLACKGEVMLNGVNFLSLVVGLFLQTAGREGGKIRGLEWGVFSVPYWEREK
jgi:hypothetical protein